MTTAKAAVTALELLDEEAPPEADALADMRAQIQADAQDQPEAYLADTMVPGGGE